MNRAGHDEPIMAAGAVADMAKTYEPSGIETCWYQRWEERGYFAPRGDGQPYCIMLPPPNVTGSLHMGHAFQHTLIDILIRYHAMTGRRTLWQCGTDHAGIATQIVVENQLRRRGLERREMGCEAFEQMVWQWKETSGGMISRQLRRMGTAMDWSRERFTLDKGLSRAVCEVFVRLFREGMVYKGKRLVNWDPMLRTAISDLEVTASEEDGTLWHIRYPVVGRDDQFVVVATTRPETMLGDVAVAVHPDDARYADLVGKKVTVPIVGREVPVITDDYVDPSFGTGCVKITPAHDFNDYEVGVRHQLPQINLFQEDASLNDNAPEGWRGLDRYEARLRIIDELRAAGLLEKEQPHRYTVPRGDRSHQVLEPYLTDQWFVRMAPLAGPAMEAVRDGRIRFIPENWNKTYFDWMENLQDWCVSRQLWWGHRIPAWYDADGNIYVGYDEEEARKFHQLPADLPLRQDTDRLDTWFSSALWPFSTLGWPDDTEDMKRYYPTNVLVTGFDIIFFWVARMIMMGLKFTGQVPFHHVLVHGLVRDAAGQKMSKSRGNIIDPIDLIDGISLADLLEKRTNDLMRPQDAAVIARDTRRQFSKGIAPFGTDALRFTFASLATQGRDIRFDIGRIQGYRNFCNKLWNATRYVLSRAGRIDEAAAGNGAASSHLEPAMHDRWILSILRRTIDQVHQHMDDYRFDLVAQSIYSFVWNEYCDWYIEMTKIASRPEENGRTAVIVLETILRLAHPLLPFITEDLWQRVAPLLGRHGDSILLQEYPGSDRFADDPEAEKEMAWIQSFVGVVRRLRAAHGIAAGPILPVYAQDGERQERLWLASHRNLLNRLARVDILAEPPAAELAAGLAGSITVQLALPELDRETELARLHEAMAKHLSIYERIGKKLADEQFVKRAPSPVVQKEKQRHHELDATLRRLRSQIDDIERVS